MVLRGIVATAEQRSMIRALNATTSIDEMSKSTLVRCSWINSNTGRRQSISIFDFDVDDKQKDGFESNIVDVVAYLQSGNGAELPTS
jgi:hypothetical protein